MLEKINNYRNVATLSDGTRVLLRPLTEEDRKKFVEMYAGITPEDLKYMRNRVDDPSVVESWVDNLDYTRVLPLLAVVNNRIVGNGTLHMGKGPSRHMAEMRIFLVREIRGRGLGTIMLKSLIEIARKTGLHILKAEIIADHSQVVKAFRNLGFEPQCTLEDFFMLESGSTRDVVLMLLPLRRHTDEF